MNRTVRVLAFAVVAALVAPTGAATWKAYGTFEPDSTYDDDKYMWFDEPEYGSDAGPTQKRIYFNAYQTLATTTNPNAGALETQFQASPENMFYAMLGVWVDCNDDGYVGYAETAAREYRNELLTDKSRCPVGDNHNKDGWVLELIPIGRTTFKSDKRLIQDLDAMVWGDQGRPVPVGAEDAPAEGGSCPISPMPKGTLHRTGALLDYADCGVGVGGTYNDAAEASGGALVPLEDEDDWDQAGHPLNVDTFGEDDAENSMVYAQDCSQDPIVDLGLVNEEFTGHGPRPLPASPSVNPEGTLPGTVNATNEALVDDCNTSNDFGHDFYATEGEHNAVEADFKKEAEYNFNFSIMSRGGAPLGVGTFGDPHGGIPTLSHAMGNGNSMWTSNTLNANAPGATRGSVTGGDVGIANATHFTFYAFVGGESLKFGSTPGSTAEYGANFCPDGFGETGGVHYGWYCNAAEWNTNPDGTPVTRYYTLAVPGQPYQFRDADCFDGTAAGVEGAGIHPAAFGEGACGI